MYSQRNRGGLGILSDLSEWLSLKAGWGSLFGWKIMLGLLLITLSRLPVLSCLARLVVTVVTVSCVQGVYIYQLYLLSRNRCTNPNPLFAVLEQLIASLRSRAIWPSSINQQYSYLESSS